MKRQAFTLIELLVVIAIIAVLAGMLVPAIGTVKAAAMSTNCKSNMRQVYIAYHTYAEDNEGALPRKYYGVAGNEPLYAYNGNDMHAGQSTYLNERACNDVLLGRHHPSVLVCPLAAKSIPTWNEKYKCYQFPTYFPNADAWSGWSQFTSPKDKDGNSMPASSMPLLMEDNPLDSGVTHGSTYPSRYFFYIHNGQMNLLYFDGHVGSIRSAQQFVLNSGGP